LPKKKQAAGGRAGPLPSARRREARWQRERRWQAIFILAGALGVALVLVLAGLGIYQSQVAPRRAVAVRVRDVTFDMGYVVSLLKRLVKDNASVSPEQLIGNIPDIIMNEELVRQEGARRELKPSADDIQAEIRKRVIERDAEAENDKAKFDKTYEEMRKEADLSDVKLREAVALSLMRERLRDRLWEEAPTHILPHVHLRGVVTATQDRIVEAETRLKAGEAFATVAEALSVDEASKTKGGDMGWIPSGGSFVAALEQLNLRYILVATEEDAKAALTRVENGEDFTAVAKEVSTDATTRERGGDLGWVPTLGLPADIASLTSMSPGQTSQPIPLAGSFALFQVLGKSPAGDLITDVALNLETGKMSPPLLGTDRRYYLLESLGREDREADENYVVVLKERTLSNWLQEVRRPDVNVVQNLMDDKKTSWALDQLK